MPPPPPPLNPSLPPHMRSLGAVVSLKSGVDNNPTAHYGCVLWEIQLYVYWDVLLLFSLTLSCQRSLTLIHV